MEIVPNPVLVVLLAMPFLVTFAALHFILFRPLLRFLVEREDVVKAARHETEDFAAKTEAHLGELEKKLRAAREEVTTLRGAARKKALDQEHAILSTARAEADTRLAEALETLQAERQRAEAQLRTMAKSLAGDIVSRVLGREIQAGA